jgi:PHD/YefM family antitoxin component YafN of YafNO toxin-antitoxin module
MTVQEQPVQIQYVSDSEGKPVGVIVPIDVWETMQQELRSERETAYLLASEPMRKRLLEATKRGGGPSPGEKR